MCKVTKLSAVHKYSSLIDCLNKCQYYSIICWCLLFCIQFPVCNRNIGEHCSGCKPRRWVQAETGRHVVSDAVVNSELKIMLPMIAILQNFSDDQITKLCKKDSP